MDVGFTWIAITWLQSSADNVNQSVIIVAGEDKTFNLTISSNGANITGLNPGSHYTITVIAVGANGEISNPSEAITLDLILSAPDDLKISSFGYTWFLLSWNPTVPKFNKHIVLVSGANIFLNMTIIGSRNSANITGLLPGSVYSVWVVTIAESGMMSPPSATIEVTTLIQGNCKYK